MKLAARFSKFLAAMRVPAATSRNEVSALPVPLIVALEPRIVYDASAASIGAAAVQPHPANAETHDGASQSAAVSATATDARAVHGYVNTPPAAGDASALRAVHGYTDVVGASADKQVVFVNSNVSDYQTLVSGLPQGTQVVILDSTKDGLAQIEQYLQQHQGVSAIHLVSHGSDGNVQIGSTWLNGGDLSAYSAELAQIGAAMKPGGDFLIYGCDVAQNADGKALVQQIASISGLNVAASTDATGAAALGGDWTLEYESGTVHTPVIFSTASEQHYGEVLAVTDETYDSELGYVTPGGAAGVTSFSLGAFTYTTDQSVEFAVDSTTVNQGGTPPLSTGAADGVLFGNVQGTQLTSMTMKLTNGDKMAVQSFDVDTFGGAVTIEGLNSSGVVVASLAINGSTSHVDLSSNAGFAGITSLRLRETDGFFLTPTLNNFTYVDLSSPPVVTASGGSTSFVEADNTASTPVAVDSGLTLTDGDATTAKHGTVSITGNFSNGQDVLAFTNTGAAQYGDISSSYNSSTGVLTLTSASGTASITAWQNAFRAVTYTDTEVSPSTSTRTVSFTLTSDAYFSSSNTVTKNVTVTATDQTPIVTTAGHTVTYYTGGSNATIDSGVTVGDSDNTTQSSGTVSITGAFHSGDTLTFTNDGSTMGNIAGSYNAATGVLTLTSAGATATDAQWGHALSAVTFSSTSSTFGSRTISFATSDGTKTSAAATDTVNVANPLQLTADSGSASFVAGDNTASAPVVVDPGLTVSDAATGTLSSATVTITGNFTSGEDFLQFTNDGSTMGNITAGSFNQITGTLTLTSSGSTATLAQWRSALDSIKYTDVAVTPNALTRTVSFTAVDSAGNTSGAVSRNVTVTATDQTPIVGATGGTRNYVGATSGVTIDTNVTVGDLDNTTQSSGTVSVSGGFHSGDTLSFTNDGSTMGNIAASYNAATGVLTLTSASATATDTQWAAALSAVKFSSTSTTYGSRTISFATSDGTKTSAAATDTINMTAPPAITTDSGSASFVAGDNTTSTPVAIDSGLTVTDGSATTLSQVTVAITGGFQSGKDVLSFTNDGLTMGNITEQSYNSATGVMTLTSSSASATLVQWQSALRSVTFTNTAVTPSNTTRTIGFTAIDGASNTSATATRTVTVTDTDQTPIVATTGGTTNYVGASFAVTIDGHVTVNDLDNSTQTSATVAVTTGFQSGDVLSFTNDGSTMGNIQASYSAGSGVLLLTSIGGTATNVQWASALSSVTFSSTSTTYGNRTIWYQVNDGTKNSAQAADTINMTAPPKITTDSGSASFVAGDNATSTPVAIDSGLTVTDGSAATLASTTVAITGGFQNGQDVLSFTNDGSTMGNITGSYNAATGVMTLTSSSATATLAQWQSALQSVTYTDTIVTPDNTTRTISFSAVDGAGNTSATATRTVTVADTDQTPIVTTTGGTTNYVGGTSAVTIDGGVSVSDRDNTTQASATVSVVAGFHSGDTLTFINTNSTTFGNIVGSYNASTGVLTLTSSGALSSDAQWSNALSAVTFSAGASAAPGNRTISFATNDGTKTSAVATDTVNLLGPPTITTDSGSAPFVAGDNVASTPVAIDPGLSLTDGVSPTLASATVSITGGFRSGEDVLAFTNTNAATFGNISVQSYNAATGVLTLTSSGAAATLAQWQAALDAVTYTDTAVTPDNTTRTIAFSAVDTSAITSNTATRTVTVTDTDQTPIVTTTGGTTNYVGASSAVTIDGGISVSDRDNATQSIGTVSIATGFNSGDTLAFTNTSAASFGNIVGSYNSATGVLTLTSSGALATDAQWANALNAVTFSTASTTLGNRTIAFATSDGTKTSAVANDTVAVLDRPHVTLDSGAASFVAADNATSTPVTVAPGLALTDATGSTFSASVAITGGFHQGQDVLALASNNATMGDIGATYNANSGVLTLTSRSGNATRGQWQAALAAITYTDTAVTPDTTTRVVSFTVTDGNGAASAVQTRSVTVADTDQTPLLGVSGGVTFTARGNGSTPVAVAPQVTITDADNTTLTSAQVAISGGFDAGHDTLSFTGSAATGNIAVSSYSAATGVLTLTSAGGTATIAQWTAALQSVTYSDSSPRAGSSRTISFTVSDGVKSSAVASNTVAIANAPSFPPIVPAALPVIVDTPASSHSPIFSDDTNPPDVLDEFDRPMPIGSVPIVQTMTFTDPNAPANMHSLDRTAVSRFDQTAFDAALAPTSGEGQSSLSDVSFTMAPNDPFSIDVATLLPPSEAMHGGADVTVRLADGRSLPGWIRYDAAHGVLRGKLPADVENVRIVVQTRDASGHVARREIVLAPRDGHAGHGDSHGAGHGVAHPKPPGHAALSEPSVARAARPVGKPSLDRQFAQARAALHVSHPRVASRRA